MKMNERVREINIKELEAFLELPKKVQESIWLDLAEENISFKELTTYFDFPVFDECESPIEKIFYYFIERYVLNMQGYIFIISPQCEIEANGKYYRVDFSIICQDWNYKEHVPGDLWSEVIVECDGHDFHEKTKEQVKRGNTRDYNLKMEGYEIIHFSGSEIFNEPEECAKKTVDYLVKHLTSLK